MAVTSLKLEALYPLPREALVLLASYLARDLTLEGLEEIIEQVIDGARAPDGE